VYEIAGWAKNYCNSTSVDEITLHLSRIRPSEQIIDSLTRVPISELPENVIVARDIRTTLAEIPRLHLFLLAMDALLAGSTRVTLGKNALPVIGFRGGTGFMPVKVVELPPQPE
jgi:hypothetical protein